MPNEVEKINQEQIFNLITGKEVSWQAIIYDLINTEQLNPWDIDLILLANKYIEKVREMEEANFLVSGKVLLAASFLLRLKAEILLEKEIRSLDEILFGNKEKENKPLEKIEIDYSEIPEIYPKTPLPRLKKVSLQELMVALNKAISTENRRIKREVLKIQVEKQTDFVLPKTKINIKSKIKNLFNKILCLVKTREKVSYKEIAGEKKEDKISCFLPVLHLDTQKKIYLEQEKHFEDIWIWLFEHYKGKKIAVQDNETALADFFKLVEK
ncbi:MAG: segregation/condensation protein A [Candidatus Pacearchaeota archaeon]